MLKPLTFALGLAVALGASSLSFAGGHHQNAGCDTCGLASPQGSVVASPQGEACNTCAPKKKCFNFKMPKLNFHMPKCTTTYEWVLKKKKVWHKGGGCGGNGCGDTGCGDCGGAPAVYPTSQVAPSGQAAPSSQAPWAAPQAAGQSALYSTPGEMKPALAADEVPPAPAIANQSRLLQLTPSGN